MYTSRFSIVALSALLLGGCLDPAEFRFGDNVSGLEFNLHSPNMGVHPSTDILADPNNPFAQTGSGLEARFAILAQGGAVASFYAWGSFLATAPNGEAQFFTADSAKMIYLANAARPEDLETVREIAIRGFQAQLDDFPDALTFTELGTASRLAPRSYFGIVELGGVPDGDWVVVTTPGDPPGQDVVRGSNALDPQRRGD